MVGIDFGTSNTVVARRGDDGSQRLVPLTPESSSIPTLLFVDPAHGVRIGFDARRAYGEAARTSGTGAAQFRLFQALKFALKDLGLEATQLFGTRVAIEKVVSWYLGALRERIEDAVPGWDRTAAVGRPSELHPDPAVDAQVQKRFEAAYLAAGFRQVHFVAEPVAAAAHLMGRFEGKVLVFDFGGGTLDVSITELSSKSIRVLASVGRDLGGYLLDEDLARARVRRHFGHGGRLRTLRGQILEVPHEVTGQVVRFQMLPFEEIRRIKRLIPELIQEAVHKAPLRGLLDFLERNLTYDLYQMLDAAKIRLSDHDGAELAFAVPPHVAFSEPLSRAEFEECVAPRVAQALDLVERALNLAGGQPVDRVVLVGGSSQVPIFRQALETQFPGKIAEGSWFDGIALGLVPAWERGLGV
jgi:hypothetical chaperone protein